jgi:hypothetical protein
MSEKQTKIFTVNCAGKIESANQCKTLKLGGNQPFPQDKVARKNFAPEFAQ